jgi:LacI family transcriptional regulator
VAKRPTIKDVALRAGVSLKTVSRVVNGEPGVRASTEEAVRRAIDELGFRRNDLAQSLRRRTSAGTIALVIGDVANPFYATIARAVEEYARQRDYLLITGSTDDDPDRERTIVTTLIERRVGGLLVVPAGRDHAYLAPEQRLGTPFVFLDRPPGNLDADAVVLDNHRGAMTGVAHLIAEGHRRIAVVSDSTSIYTAERRVAGFRDAMAAAGIPVDDRLLKVDVRDTQDAEKATYELLRMPEPPTAVFSINNRMTVGILRALSNVGQALAVSAFDDFELSDVVPYPIAVLSDNAFTMGQVAAELLFARLDGNARPFERVELPTTLVAHGHPGTTHPGTSPPGAPMSPESAAGR